PAVVLHTTVGTLHATMALRIARHERVPMVVMAGESATFSESACFKIGRQWLRLLTDLGGPARLPARGGRTTRAGVPFGADRIPDGDDFTATAAGIGAAVAARGGSVGARRAREATQRV